MVTLWMPLFHSILYTFGIVHFARGSGTTEPVVDFFDFDSLREGFQSPALLYCGWVHYLVTDVLTGRMLYLDSLARNDSTLFHVVVMIPCLFATMMLCPLGFFLTSVLLSLLGKPSSIMGSISVKLKVE